MEAEPLLTPAQVARQLVIEEKTLAEWRSTGRQALPFVKIGGLVRYRSADVQNFVASRVSAISSHPAAAALLRPKGSL